MSCVPIEVAADALGLSKVTLYGKHGIYRDFIVTASNGIAKFNLDGFRRVKEREEELLAKTQLFTEYLNHIENMTYEEMSKITGVNPQNLWRCDYGIKPAKKIVSAFKSKRPYHLRRFNEYYEW